MGSRCVNTVRRPDMALINPASSLSWTKLTQNPEWHYRHSRRQNQQFRIHISSKVRILQAQGSSHQSVHVALGRVLMGAVERADQRKVERGLLEPGLLEQSGFWRGGIKTSRGRCESSSRSSSVERPPL